MDRWALALVAAVILGSTTGCSIKKMATKSVAGALSSGGTSVFASDDDPELVRDATPFALKTMEALLVDLPDDERLLLATSQGFTQYAHAFIVMDADRIEPEDYARAQEIRDRALRLFLRARGYGLRALEVRHPGISDQLILNPQAALEPTTVEDVPYLYWTGAAWGSAASLGRDRPELVADISVVVAMIKRANELDEQYEQGAIHGVLISLESLPANMGGSLERARAEYERAVELSQGKLAGYHVSFAESVLLKQQDRAQFESALNLALAIDPDDVPGTRLQNIIAQDRASMLLDRMDDLFWDSDTPDPSP